MNNSKPLSVLSIDWKTPQKLIRLSDGQILTVSVSSCVGDQDEVIERDGGYYVPCENGYAQLLPLYLRSDTLRCGGIVIPLKVKELETDQEYESFGQLSEFHYREGRFLLYLAVLFVWIFPAVLVWLIATNFEREFSEGSLTTEIQGKSQHEQRN